MKASLTLTLFAFVQLSSSLLFDGDCKPFYECILDKELNLPTSLIDTKLCPSTVYKAVRKCIKNKNSCLRVVEYQWQSEKCFEEKYFLEYALYRLGEDGGTGEIYEENNLSDEIIQCFADELAEALGFGANTKEVFEGLKKLADEAVREIDIAGKWANGDTSVSLSNSCSDKMTDSCMSNIEEFLTQVDDCDLTDEQYQLAEKYAEAFPCGGSANDELPLDCRKFNDIQIPRYPEATHDVGGTAANPRSCIYVSLAYTLFDEKAANQFCSDIVSTPEAKQKYIGRLVWIKNEDMQKLVLDKIADTTEKLMSWKNRPFIDNQFFIGLRSVNKDGNYKWYDVNGDQEDYKFGTYPPEYKSQLDFAYGGAAKAYMAIDRNGTWTKAIGDKLHPHGFVCEIYLKE